MMDGARVPSKHVVVGTAGHIDHGKTSLVKALTGTDTDRLPEEKARGITIDLGFAFLEEPDGLTIEVVDVPGHERFVKNMLAGVGGIDLAMLVIAADEGVMPQTREHLAICSLLHIRTGLVVLTKIDMVETDWIELVRDDVATLVRGGFLEGAPVVPVSAKTGAGLDELRATLRRLAETVPARGTDPLPPLPIDRVCTIKGFGTVVSRTLVAGDGRGGSGRGCVLWRGGGVLGCVVPQTRSWRPRAAPPCATGPRRDSSVRPGSPISKFWPRARRRPWWRSTCAAPASPASACPR